jgi:hypothetical protein
MAHHSAVVVISIKLEVLSINIGSQKWDGEPNHANSLPSSCEVTSTKAPARWVCERDRQSTGKLMAGETFH